MQEGTFLIPPKGRQYSGAYDLNFLWNKDSVYIMDNQRAALWCWYQHLKQNESYCLFHVDKHFDTLYSNIEYWLKNLPILSNISIEDYLSCSCESKGDSSPLFSWGNYLSIFLEVFSHNIDTCYFLTHEEGDKPRFENLINCTIWKAPEYMEYWLSNSKKGNWIFNLDIDYFFTRCGSTEIQMFSDDYLENLLRPISVEYKKGNISVITISLSPECSGGWEKAITTCDKVCKIMNIPFNVEMI